MQQVPNPFCRPTAPLPPANAAAAGFSPTLPPRKKIFVASGEKSGKLCERKKFFAVQYFF
jgi:hypothetical protein